MKKIKERSPELIEVGKEVYNSLRKNYKIGTGHPTAKVEWWSPQFFVIEKDGKSFSVTVKELALVLQIWLIFQCIPTEEGRVNEI